MGPDDLSSGDAETLISSAIAGLNSDDIESFQILKDGSATSISVSYTHLDVYKRQILANVIALSYLAGTR